MRQERLDLDLTILGDISTMPRVPLGSLLVKYRPAKEIVTDQRITQCIHLGSNSRKDAEVFEDLLLIRPVPEGKSMKVPSILDIIFREKFSLGDLSVTDALAKHSCEILERLKDFDAHYVCAAGQDSYWFDRKAKQIHLTRLDLRTAEHELFWTRQVIGSKTWFVVRRSGL